MKKTCFALALLGALNLAYGQGSADEPNLAELQDAVTLTFSNAANTNTGYVSTKYGIAFTLGNNLDKKRVTTTATQGGNTLTTIPTFSVAELTSITLKTYGDTWSNNDTKAYIADQATKTVVAISSTTISKNAVTGGGSVTFDFQNTVLSSNTSYLLICANASTVNNDIRVKESAMADNGKIYSNGRGYATIGNDLNAETSSQLGFVRNQGGVEETTFSPVVTIIATPKNIPEPSAAALGLLALGGLAARRRRK